MRVEFSPEAESDLDEIAAYIAADDPDAALAWVDKLVDRALRIANAPRAGRVVAELADPSVREVILGNYRIVYGVERQRVLVLTIIEGHRRLPRRR
jgi:addiction module RelE/StbE family toxin